MANYKIINMDAIAYLKSFENNTLNSHIVTGLPDMEEVNMTYIDYVKFFTDTTELIFDKVVKDVYIIFVQTSRKSAGKLIDKSYLITDIANKKGVSLLWHKIVLVRDVGKVSLHRPSYSHMLCYSYNKKSGVAFPDVISVSKKLYCNGTPLNACIEIMKFLIRNNKISFITDLFCGMSTVGIYALIYKLNYIGIDIDSKQCDISNKNLVKIEQYLKNHINDVDNNIVYNVNNIIKG